VQSTRSERKAAGLTFGVLCFTVMFLSSYFYFLLLLFFEPYDLPGPGSFYLFRELSVLLFPGTASDLLRLHLS
jgi:hypothetical protein